MFLEGSRARVTVGDTRDPEADARDVHEVGVSSGLGASLLTRLEDELAGAGLWVGVENGLSDVSMIDLAGELGAERRVREPKSRRREGLKMEPSKGSTARMRGAGVARFEGDMRPSTSRILRLWGDMGLLVDGEP